jgi:PAS domain S-box-containing protein
MASARILVVEDEAVTAMDLKSDLIRLGYDVPVVVARGEDAILAAADVMPDLVLMDITLAGAMSGIEAADQIRTSLGIPVVFLTAHADAETLGRAKRSQPYGYLPKPCGADTMMTTIEMALSRGEADALRRKAEARLRQVLEQQKIILANIGMGVLYSQARKIHWVSPGLLRMFGYTLEEVQGRDTELLYPDRGSYETIGREGYAALARGDVYTGEIPMKRKDGAAIWCHLVGQAIDGNDRENGSIWVLEDVTGRRQLEQDRERLIAELREALAKVKLLSGFIPICASCKKIRNDAGYWQQIEVYIRDHSEAEFSHGICPDCGKRLYGDLYREVK